ncbi:chaperone protein dnaJ 15-like isoform X1 [Ziziphus jujuba]|uniref:Chaperone protein dnaJ 15-like isoform X1 n=1 Tax=Ziziphus jujuba TaxID=326968 RepID=A0ABM4AD97_ZIZJJ|nr:chaperone protein dnaJ 15-like isoform X1 [Ziziphus jujuba]
MEYSQLGIHSILSSVSGKVLSCLLSWTFILSGIFRLLDFVLLQVDKQNAHFFGVTINEQQAECGIVVRVTSNAQSKFKLLYFEQDVNGGYGLALQVIDEIDGALGDGKGAVEVILKMVIVCFPLLNAAYLLNLIVCTLICVLI